MRHVAVLVAALALAAIGPRGVLAQGLGITAGAGLFNPGTLLAVASTVNDADVRLDPAPAVSAGLDVRLSGGLVLFASVDYAASRVAHTAMLRLGPPVRPYSTVLVYAPMGGIAIALPIPSALVRTQLRIGGGYAVYRFDQGVVSPWIRDPAALVALGLMAGGADRVGYVAEVRCVISSFDATRLPLRVPSAQRTTQQDWTAVVGLRFRL